MCEHLMMWCGAERCDVVWCSVVWCSVVWWCVVVVGVCGVVCCSAVWCGVVLGEDVRQSCVGLKYVEYA